MSGRATDADESGEEGMIPDPVAALREAIAEHDLPRCGKFIESGMCDEDGPIPGCDCERHIGHDGDCYGAPDDPPGWDILRGVLAATGPATLDDVRAWLAARGLRIDESKILAEWREVHDGDYPGYHVLYSARGGGLASYYHYGRDGKEPCWSWMVRGINGFGQRVATEAEARAAVEARLAERGWRWVDDR